MSAEIIDLSERLRQHAEAELDVWTAVDVAIRDLREIRASWGSDAGFERLVECETTLRRAINLG